jgi:hypothetical protein
MKQLSFFLLLSAILLGGCKKSSISNNACKQIKQAVVENDKELLKKEINNICAAIPVVRTAADPDGLQNSLDILVKKLNASCGVSAESLCFFCIKTLPAQSEIRITVNATVRIIDISYNTDMKLVFVSMHN